MSAVSSPYGFKPVLPQGGTMRLTPHGNKIGWNGIASGYASNIFTYAPVTIVTADGSLQVGGTMGALTGIFAGVQYKNAQGVFIQSSYWPASTVATEIVAQIYPFYSEWLYQVQANGSIPAAAVGDQANCVNPGAGNTIFGTSTAGLSSTLAGAGVTAQFTIVGFAQVPNSTVGDAFTDVIVRPNQSQFGPASVVAV